MKILGVPFVLFFLASSASSLAQPLNTYFRDTAIRYEGVTFDFKNLKTGYREAHILVDVWNARDEVVMIKKSDFMLTDERGNRNTFLNNHVVVPPVGRRTVDLTFALKNKTLQTFTFTVLGLTICEKIPGETPELIFYKDTSYAFNYFQVRLTQREQARSGMKTTLQITLTSEKLLEVDHKNVTVSYGERKQIRHKKSGERPLYLSDEKSTVNYLLYFPKVAADSTPVTMKNVFHIYNMRAAPGFSAAFKNIPLEEVYKRNDIEKIE